MKLLKISQKELNQMIAKAVATAKAEVQKEAVIKEHGKPLGTFANCEVQAFEKNADKGSIEYLITNPKGGYIKAYKSGKSFPFFRSGKGEYVDDLTLGRAVAKKAAKSTVKKADTSKDEAELKELIKLAKASGLKL